MVISAVRGLSVDERKQAILKMSQFVLREPSDNIRDSLYKRTLEIGIYLSEKEQQVTGSEGILEIVEKQFFGIRLEKEVAEQYLKQMEKEGIIRVETGKYLLQEERKDQIRRYSENALTLISSCEANFIEAVRQKIGGGLSPNQVDMLRSCFYQFIIRLVSRYIETTANLYVKGTLVRISQATGENLVRRSLDEVSDLGLRDIAGKILIEWMQSPDDSFIQYIFLMRQNFLCLEVLNLDPECRMLQREEFSKKSIFIDTNVLLNMIVESELNLQTRKMIDNTRRLGCTVYVTKRTIEELNVLLDKSKKTLKTVKSTPRQLSKSSNLFIRAYGKNVLGGSTISSADYMNRFGNIENVLNDMGIKVFGEEHTELKELPAYSTLVEEVQKCFLRLRGRIKTIDVADHDAFHLLLVKKLRDPKAGSILGPDKWFLSYDLTLPSTDRYINRHFEFSDRTSAVMVAHVWNEIISPFLLGIVTQEDLVDVLKAFISSEFTPVSEGVDFEILAKLEVDWREYDWLEIEEIIDITKQRFVIRYIARREGLARTGDTEALEELRSEFNLAFTRLIGEISSRKIERVETRLHEKEKETEMLKLSVSKLEETKSGLQESLASEQRARIRAIILSLRMRYISGVSGIVLLVIGTIMIAVTKETVSWQVITAYMAFLVLGAILLLMSIAPEQVSGRLGLGQRK